MPAVLTPPHSSARGQHRRRPDQQSSHEGHSPSTYVPALDGVRALAVAAVLAFHGGLSWARGGFLGVDAFFVLSGYLITSLLLAEWQRTGRIALRAFWLRRARRLLPALLLVIGAVMIGARSLLPPEEVRLLRGDGLAALFYVANWRMIYRGGDYFAQTAAPSPLQHVWSLGIEEQFYLLWPLLLAALLLGSRRRLRLLLVVCLAGVLVSSVALALVYRTDDPGRAYYGTDTRASSLLTGAALATWLALRKQRPRSPVKPTRLLPILGALAVVGVAGTAWAWTRLSGSDGRLYHGGLLLGAVAVAAVLAHVAVAPTALLARLLSLPPLPWLGRISYGVYLWHWPVFLAATADRTGMRGTALFGLRCLITVVVATASYLLVERPIRSGALLRRPSVLWAAAGGALAAGAALVVAVTAVPALPTAPTDASLSSVIAAGKRDREGLSTVPAAARWPEHHRRPGQPVIVDVFGDSVARGLVLYLPPHPGLVFHDRTIPGCGVAKTDPYLASGRLIRYGSGGCTVWPDLMRGHIVQDNPDVAFMLFGRWETMDRVLHGRYQHVGMPDFDAYLRSELELAITTAGVHGAHVVLATAPFTRRGEKPDGSLYPEDNPQRVTDWNRLLRDVVARHPNASIVELNRRVGPDGRFTSTVAGIRVRVDGVHFTPSGVQRWVGPWLLPQLLAVLPP